MSGLRGYCFRDDTTDRKVVGANDMTYRQAEGLANGPHGRRPTDGYAQPDYGMGLKNSRHGLARIVAVAHSNMTQ
ncbi:MAG: hypothetical protein RIS47_1902 [Bacteroidota bacterium]|jgi:hypothetical protein